MFALNRVVLFALTDMQRIELSGVIFPHIEIDSFKRGGLLEHMSNVVNQCNAALYRQQCVEHFTHLLFKGEIKIYILNIVLLSYCAWYSMLFQRKTTEYGPEMLESFCHCVAMFVQTMEDSFGDCRYFYKLVWCCY